VPSAHCFECTECWVHLSAQDLLCTECWVHSRPRAQRLSAEFASASCVVLITGRNIFEPLDLFVVLRWECSNHKYWLWNTVRSAVFVLRYQPQNFENVTLVARRRKHFRVFFGDIFGCSTPSKRGVLVHKTSLASCERCRHSVGHVLWRVLSNKVIWVLGHVKICRLEVRHSPCCTLFLITVLELNRCCAICISRGLIWQSVCYLKLSLLLFGTNCVVVITQYWSWNCFHHQWIGRQNKKLQIKCIPV